MNHVSNFEELDRAIEAMIANPELPLPGADGAVDELLQVAADLRQLPRPDFKMRLKTELEWVASARPLSSPREPQPLKEADILPSLFGHGYGTYPLRGVNFAMSLTLHAVAMVLIAVLGVLAFRARPKDQAKVEHHVYYLSEYVPPAGTNELHGGGSGGDRDKQNASHGALPKADTQQLTPPVVTVKNLDPKLPAEPTIIAPNLRVPESKQVGDPLSVLVNPSNGPGVRGGIGNNTGGGVGNNGDGPGYGPGRGGNFGGDVYSVGNGISAPRVIYDPEPEYSPEARAAKYQGTVTLVAVIAPDGRPRGLRVQRALGMGLDEKALEAVNTWRFDPARKDGQPVAVMIEIEVTFHLY